MKVLGLMGSPRLRGNSDLLLDAALAGAEAQGAECRKVLLSKLDLAPCRHCDGCTRTQGTCVVQDEMQPLYEPLRTADRILIASPVFFMSLTAQTKMMIDRCQPFWVMKYLAKTPVAQSEHPRKGLYLGVGGCDFSTLFDSARLILRSFFTIAEVPDWEMLTFDRVEQRGEIADHPTALRDAEAAGRRLVRPAE
ncbi:MAG: flavodoxin family protein [Armatimonadetes bacterium]|nr:flavodoxin family protein [Armatimonadota bacterium]